MKMPMRTIHRDGTTIEAVMLSQTENAIRAVVEGGDDVIAFFNVHGTRVSEECEPVRIECAWARNVPSGIPTEAEYICPKELASRLIHLLFGGEEPVNIAVLEQVSLMYLSESCRMAQRPTRFC